jgi:hypothetical protein
MEVAAQKMRDQGWEVDDVHLHESFDFSCTRGSEELHLEVKGTVGHYGPVFVTALEVNHALDHGEQAAIAIVSDIHAAADAHGRLTATGGAWTFMRPWAPMDRELTAIAFKWAPPRKAGRNSKLGAR